MSLNDVVMILLTALGVIITGIAGHFVSEFTALRHSVDSLNLKIGDVLNRIDQHENRIVKLEENL